MTSERTWNVANLQQKIQVFPQDTGNYYHLINILGAFEMTEKWQEIRRGMGNEMQRGSRIRLEPGGSWSASSH